MLALRRDGERVSFSIPVTPRASTNAVVALLAETLGLPRRAIRLERGAAAPTKRISVPRDAEADLRRLTK